MAITSEIIGKLGGRVEVIPVDVTASGWIGSEVVMRTIEVPKENTMEELKTQVQALNAQDWQTFLNWVVGEESNRRESLPAVEQAQAEIVKELQDAGKLPLPDALTDTEELPEDVSDVPEWVNPGTDHSAMYREGDIVRYRDRIVRSTHKGLNSWEPGTLGFDGRIWEDITPVAAEENPATGETITEWRPGIAATVGMKLTYNGATYEVIQAHTTQADWLPDALPALYKRLG